MPRYPVILGETGTSGARMLHAALERRGVYMGVNIDATADAVDVIPFFERYTVDVLRHTGRVDYELADLPEALRNSALTYLEGAMTAYLAAQASSGGPWGLKAPRAIYMLPFFRELFPDMLFVQMIRDGRHMAQNRNQLQVRRHYEPLFREPVGERPELAAARLWAKANGEAADWCERHLPGRHLLLRFEELSNDPTAAIGRLLEFLDWRCPPAELAKLAEQIRGSADVDRLPPGGDADAEVESAAAPGLVRFGYA